MTFKGLMGKARELAGTANEAAGKIMDGFNEALPTMRALGFTVKGSAGGRLPVSESRQQSHRLP